MIESITGTFTQIALDYPRWNFIFFYDANQWWRLVGGLKLTILLSIACVVLSCCDWCSWCLASRFFKTLGSSDCSRVYSIFSQHTAICTATIFLLRFRSDNPHDHRSRWLDRNSTDLKRRLGNNLALFFCRAHST